MERQARKLDGARCMGWPARGHGIAVEGNVANAPGVQRVGGSSQAEHDGDIQRHVAHGAPSVLLPAVGGDSVLEVGQGEGRRGGQVIGAILRACSVWCQRAARQMTREAIASGRPGLACWSSPGCEQTRRSATLWAAQSKQPWSYAAGCASGGAQAAPASGAQRARSAGQWPHAAPVPAAWRAPTQLQKAAGPVDDLH